MLNVIATRYGVTSGTATFADAVRNQDKRRPLLKQHVDVVAVAADGTTALHWAAHWNDAEMTEDPSMSPLETHSGTRSAQYCAIPPR